MDSYCKNSLGLRVLPPMGEIIKFNNVEEQQEFIDKYEIAKYKPTSQGDTWLYKGRGCPREGVPCTIYGYQVFNEMHEQLVIEFLDGSLHCILYSHLKEMQSPKYDNSVYYEVTKEAAES